MIRPALAETAEAVRRALDGAGTSAADLAALVLVGGSSRIPLVPQLLSEEFGRDVTVAPDPRGRGRGGRGAGRRRGGRRPRRPGRRPPRPAPDRAREGGAVAGAALPGRRSAARHDGPVPAAGTRRAPRWVRRSGPARWRPAGAPAGALPDGAARAGRTGPSGPGTLPLVAGGPPARRTAPRCSRWRGRRSRRARSWRRDRRRRRARAGSRCSPRRVRWRWRCWAGWWRSGSGASARATEAGAVTPAARR